MYNKEYLVDMIRDKAISHGEFELRSGQKSNFYIDLSKVVMFKDGLEQICLGLCEMEVPKSPREAEYYWHEFDSIGGPAVGAIPLVTAMMMQTGIGRSFFVRKEAKEHGKLDLIEGNLEKGDRVLLIEDVTTTGGSVIKTINAIKEAGGEVKKILTVLDRGTDTAKKFKDLGYDFASLLVLADVIAAN